MATYIDRPIVRIFIKAWGQIVLLLSILFAFSAHAASEEISGIAAALGLGTKAYLTIILPHQKMKHQQVIQQNLTARCQRLLHRQ